MASRFAIFASAFQQNFPPRFFGPERPVRPGTEDGLFAYDESTADLFEVPNFERADDSTLAQPVLVTNTSVDEGMIDNLPDSEEIHRLKEQHRHYSEQLEALLQKPYLSEQEQLEEIRLKKLKLYVKDRILYVKDQIEARRTAKMDAN
jgi:hypothetical protein